MRGTHSMTQALLNIGDFVGFAEQPTIAVPVQAPQCHYMLRMHPNYVMKAERQLLERGRSPYVPKEQKSKSVGWGKTDRRWMPIFHGVLFIPDFEANLPALKKIADGIGGFVKFDGAALKVSQLWMTKIRTFEDLVRSTKEERRFKLGQQVAVKGGAWDLWEGRISSLDPHNRITILIHAIAGEVPVSLDESQVEAV